MLLSNEIPVVQDYDCCAFNRHQHRKNKPSLNTAPKKQQAHSGRSNFQDRRREGNVNREETTNFCYKCGESALITTLTAANTSSTCFQCGFLGHTSGRCLKEQEFGNDASDTSMGCSLNFSNKFSFLGSVCAACDLASCMCKKESQITETEDNYSIGNDDDMNKMTNTQPLFSEILRLIIPLVSFGTPWPNK